MRKSYLICIVNDVSQCVSARMVHCLLKLKLATASSRIVSARLRLTPRTTQATTLSVDSLISTSFWATTMILRCASPSSGKLVLVTLATPTLSFLYAFLFACVDLFVSLTWLCIVFSA